jgi:hypothetical protein
MTRALLFGGRFVLAAMLLAMPSVANAQEDGELRRAFDDVMRDPTGPVPNFRYARLAIERGELRKALAAYERVLARDPTNAEALAGRARILRQLEPETTRFTASIGGFYQTNPRHANVSNTSTDDFSYTGRFGVTDERRLFGMRWRTEGDVFALNYANFRDIDIGSAGVRAGPVIPLDNLRRVHAFAGMSYSWLARRTFFGEPTAGLNFEFDDTGPFRGFIVRGGYQLLGRHLTSRDGVFVEAYPRFVFADVVLKGSTANISPFWRYNGVVGHGAAVEPFGVPFPSRLHQLGIRGDYVVPVIGQLALGVNASYEYRHYFEQFTAEPHHRRDHVIVPGGQVVLFGLFANRLDLIASYNFEHRTSNDGVARYNNHITGVRAQWRF